MCFVFGEEKKKDDALFYQRLSWNFLLSIAMIDLYLKEKYLENTMVDPVPYGILVQQTLSYLATNPGIMASNLASNLLTLSVFKNITLDEYRLILKKLLETKLIEQTADKELYIGEVGEKLLNTYEFYSVFTTTEDYDVIYNGKVLGTIAKLLPIGSKFGLAGETWEVIETSKKRKTIQVKQAKGFSTNNWEA